MQCQMDTARPLSFSFVVQGGFSFGVAWADLQTSYSLLVFLLLSFVLKAPLLVMEKNGSATAAILASFRERIRAGWQDGKVLVGIARSSKGAGL